MIADYLKFQEVVGGKSEQNHECNGTKLKSFVYHLENLPFEFIVTLW